MSLEMNKIAGAVLVGGLVTLGSSILAEKLVKPEAAHVAVAVPQPLAEAPAGAATPQAVEPVSPLLAAADVAAGEATAKKCTVCHSFDKGAPAKVGPNLWGVVGGPHAHAEGFAYSDAMKKLHDEPWSYEALNAFLAQPQKDIPGTKMSFPGLPKAQDRANVIAWLRTRSDSPVPLPTEAEIKAATQAAQPAQQAAVAPAQQAEAPAPAPSEGGQPAVTAAPAQGAQPAGSQIAALLPSADPAQGQAVAKKCAVCHSFEKGAPNKVGPNLYDVVGGPHAHKEDYKYSEAMAKLRDQPWTYEALDGFLASPKDAVPGTKMAFPGLKKPEERAAVIAYLRSLSDAPKPLPEPAGGAAAQPAQPGRSSEAAPAQPAEGTATEQPATEQPAAQPAGAEQGAAAAPAPSAETAAAQPAPTEPAQAEQLSGQGAEAPAAVAAPAPSSAEAAPAASEAQPTPAADAQPQQAAAPAAAQGGGDFVALLKSADVAAGEKIAKRCAICHTFEKGAPNKVGPNLWNVVGGPHAHKEDFKYSDAMMALHDKTWTYEELNTFLTSPKDYAPGTKMAFAGLKKPEDRAAVIAYLRSLSDSPQPLP